MNDNERTSDRSEALVENIGKRDDLPPGWRGIYDQLIVDLYKLEPHLRVAVAKAKVGELRVDLERHSTRAEELRSAAGPTTGSRTHTCHSDDENEPCSASGR